MNDLQEYKLKRGWWFSVFFLILVVLLILFLAFIDIVEKNRDVVVSILGVITGSISSMVAIASGRDPSEVEELKDLLSKANADREALIARLRDAQIQKTIIRDQMTRLHESIIDRLTELSTGQPIKKEEVQLDPTVEEWLPKEKAKDEKNV